MDGFAYSNSEIEALSVPTVAKPKKAFAIAFAVFATVLAGCATGLGANSYEHASAGQVARVEEGQVVAVRAAGTGRSELRGGNNSSVAGAVRRSATKSKDFNYTVRLRSGELVAIAQRGDYAISSGTPVLVEYGAQARVIPQNASIGY